MAKNILKTLGFIILNTFLFRRIVSGLTGLFYESVSNRNITRLIILSFIIAVIIVLLIKFGVTNEETRW